MGDLFRESCEFQASPACVLGLFEPQELRLEVVDAGFGIDALVFQVAESHELGHGVPVPVCLDPLADLSVLSWGSLEEVQYPRLERKDEGIVVVVVVGLVLGEQFSHVRGFVRLVFFWVGGDWSVAELSDPVGLLGVPILDGDNEVGCALVGVSNETLGGFERGESGQIASLLIFQVSEPLGGEVTFGLVVPFSSSYGFDESLGNLHDGLGVVDVDLQGDRCASRGDGDRRRGPGSSGGLVGGVDGYIGHRLVVEWAGVMFAEEGVLADVALREFVVKEEEEAVKALVWREVELRDGSPPSSRGDEVGDERSLRRSRLEWGFGVTGHWFLIVPCAAFIADRGFAWW
jgi:hypothetical protein